MYNDRILVNLRHVPNVWHRVPLSTDSFRGPEEDGIIPGETIPPQKGTVSFPHRLEPLEGDVSCQLPRRVVKSYYSHIPPLNANIVLRRTKQ